MLISLRCILLASLVLFLCAVYNSSLTVLPKNGTAACRLYCHITDRFCRSVVFCDPNSSSSRLCPRFSTRLRSLTCCSAPFQNAVRFVHPSNGSVSFTNLESINGSSVPRALLAQQLEYEL